MTHPLTDFILWQQFLTRFGIGFQVQPNGYDSRFPGPSIQIESYGPIPFVPQYTAKNGNVGGYEGHSVSICFDENEKFTIFNIWG